MSPLRHIQTSEKWKPRRIGRSFVSDNERAITLPLQSSASATTKREDRRLRTSSRVGQCQLSVQGRERTWTAQLARRPTAPPHVRTFYFWRLLLERFRERMGASSGERLGRKRIMCVVLPTGVTM